MSNDPSGTGPEGPSYDEQQAPNSYDAPGNSYGSPPPNSQQAPSSSDAVSPSAGGEVCDVLCNVVDVCFEGSTSECVSECRESEDAQQIEPCLQQAVSLYQCIVAFSCDLEDEAWLEVCPNELSAYVQCIGLEPEPEPKPDPQPDPVDCTLEGQCQGCSDACETCLCETNTDFEACSVECF